LLGVIQNQEHRLTRVALAVLKLLKFIVSQFNISWILDFILRSSMYGESSFTLVPLSPALLN
jgi:hypothetical protein